MVVLRQSCLTLHGVFYCSHLGPSLCEGHGQVSGILRGATRLTDGHDLPCNDPLKVSGLNAMGQALGHPHYYLIDLHSLFLELSKSLNMGRISETAIRVI